MAKALEKVRTVADDFLRIVGVGGLVSSSVGGLLLSLAGTAIAYLRGVRGEWLFFAVGATAGVAVVLVATMLVWAFRRARRSASLKAQAPMEKGYLDHKREQLAAMKDLHKLTRDMTSRTLEITGAMKKGKARLAIVRSLPEAWHDRGTAWVSNVTARRLHKHAIAFSALADDYEATAQRLMRHQKAFFSWVLEHGQSGNAELMELRGNIATFLASIRSANNAQRGWKTALQDPLLKTTGKMIRASRTMMGVLDRIMGTNEGLISHVTELVTSIDQHLEGDGKEPDGL